MNISNILIGLLVLGVLWFIYDKRKKRKSSGNESNTSGTDWLYKQAQNFPAPNGRSESNQFLYKPKAHNRDVLVVLLPTSVANPETSVYMRNPNGDHIGKGNWHDAHGENGGRMHYYFNKPGRSFPDRSVLDVGGTLYKIPKSANRYG